MSLTVRELIDIPTLRTRVLAGASGLEREVLWAHSCELPEPWHWMGSGDLVMTTGPGFPPSPADQVNYLTRLAEAGLSGVALAEGMTAPPLTQEAGQAADALAFPVLETAFEIPFVMLARAVADSNQRETQARLARILRVYDTFRRTISDSAGDQATIRAIAKDVGMQFHVADVDDASVALSSDGTLDDATLEELLRQLRERVGPLPSVVRMNIGSRRYLVQPLRADEAWVLVTPIENQVIDLTVLQHVATIALIQLERRRSAALARLHAGARTLSHLINGRVDAQLAAGQLSDYGIAGPPWQIAMLAPEGAVELLRIQRRLLTASVAHLMDRLDDWIVVLTSAGDSGALAKVAAACGLAAGVSDAVTSLNRIPEAVRESRWALESAQAGDVVPYGSERSSFLPRTVSEGHAVVTRVLGPVLAYDAEHGTDLLASLQALFAAERSWQAAAKELCVHKQTLVYRMRRVEQLTGRHLDRLDDVTELHLALRTHALLTHGGRTG